MLSAWIAPVFYFSCSAVVWHTFAHSVHVDQSILFTASFDAFSRTKRKKAKIGYEPNLLLLTPQSPTEKTVSSVRPSPSFPNSKDITENSPHRRRTATQQAGHSRHKQYSQVCIGTFTRVVAIPKCPDIAPRRTIVKWRSERQERACVLNTTGDGAASPASPLSLPLSPSPFSPGLARKVTVPRRTAPRSTPQPQRQGRDTSATRECPCSAREPPSRRTVWWSKGTTSRPGHAASPRHDGGSRRRGADGR